uniref:Uncharacterized protein n=1 Tax=viral metagenome TaxID=1070528 RepID=A0A6M3IFC2_9ZZZZ
MNYECLKDISKEDVEKMSFEELKLLAERMNQEKWTAQTRQQILNVLDIRDAEHDPRVIEVDFTPKGDK